MSGAFKGQVSAAAMLREKIVKRVIAPFERPHTMICRIL